MNPGEETSNSRIQNDLNKKKIENSEFIFIEEPLDEVDFLLLQTRNWLNEENEAKLKEISEIDDSYVPPDDLELDEYCVKIEPEEEIGWSSNVVNVNLENQNDENSQVQSIPQNPNVKTKQPVKMHKCRFCQYKSHRKSRVTQHTHTHYRNRCSKCHQGFSQKRDLTKHEKTCESRVYKCEVCKYSTTYKRNLARHVETHDKKKSLASTVNNPEFTIKGEPIDEVDYMLMQTESWLNEENEAKLNKKPETDSDSPVSSIDLGLAGNYVKIELEDDPNNQNGQNSQMENLLENMKAKKPPKMHECTFCSFKSKRTSDVLKHSQIHYPHRCSKCRKGYSRKCDLTKHEKKCECQEYKCEVCKYSTTYKTHLTRHMRIHNGERPYDCTICSKSFSVSDHLKSHIRTHKKELKFACTKCGLRFADDESKQVHETRCRRRHYECYRCRYKCFYKCYLDDHMRVKHTREKPFQCDICGNFFGERSKLKFHRTTHREFFPYRCIKCYRGYSTESERISHEKQCPRRQYQCYLCEVMFRYAVQLKSHMCVEHTGERPFKCKYCDQSFTTKCVAVRHMTKRCKKRENR